jgi:hypothetical protein
VNRGNASVNESVGRDAEMSEWVQVRLNSAVLERWELPNIDYPVLSDRVS